MTIPADNRPPEAVRATAGVLYMSGSRAASLLLETGLALLLPALMGGTDYGYWTLFRSIILMLVGMTFLGGESVIGVRYVSLRVQGRSEDAWRLFKTFFVLRLAVGLAAALAGGASTN